MNIKNKCKWILWMFVFSKIFTQENICNISIVEVYKVIFEYTSNIWCNVEFNFNTFGVGTVPFAYSMHSLSIFYLLSWMYDSWKKIHIRKIYITGVTWLFPKIQTMSHWKHSLSAFIHLIYHHKLNTIFFIRVKK